MVPEARSLADLRIDLVVDRRRSTLVVAGRRSSGVGRRHSNRCWNQIGRYMLAVAERGRRVEGQMERSRKRDYWLDGCEKVP